MPKPVTDTDKPRQIRVTNVPADVYSGLELLAERAGVNLIPFIKTQFRRMVDEQPAKPK
jgi:hypothetical protein